MVLFVFSTILFLLASLLSLISRREKWKRLLGCGGVVAASLTGLVPAVLLLAGGDPVEMTLGSPIPSLTLRLGLDALSAFFLVPIFGLSALVGLYALGYLKGEGRWLGNLPFFPLLVVSMAGVVTARNGFLFLMFWEIMSLTSYFLVTTEHEQREVRHAGWIYLAATHLATAFLLVFFVLIFKKTGSFDFKDFALLKSGPWTGLLFIFALVGFGTKAGIFPFHIWLPHAHPAAPSYISALMSGVMIKTGIYGILRTLTLLPPPPLWCGEALILFGIASAVLGVLYALMQHDLKKLLAYHSVENIGIIVTGLGLGMVGRSQQNLAVEWLGFGGALFHVLNHAVFKGLLFLGAGNILRATHTKSIDRLGGLIRFMPLTGITFLVASAAICGLPPFNGFISEWLLYLGLLEAAKTSARFPLFLCVSAMVGIAFAGGLAVVCFTKVFGVAFLGNPRTEHAKPLEAKWKQLAPMIFLATACLTLGIMPQLILPWLQTTLLSIGSNASPLATGHPLVNLGIFSRAFAILIALFLLVHWIRSLLFSSRTVRIAPTWDCGFKGPTPRMQYTASSFAEPIRTFFHVLLKPAVSARNPEGLFPDKSHFEEHVDDLSERLWFSPLVDKIASFLSGLRKRQRTRVQDYLAYIFVTLILLLLVGVWIGI